MRLAGRRRGNMVERRRASRRRRDEHLVSALVSLFRVDGDGDVDRVRRLVPTPRDARSAIVAARTAYREVVVGHPDPYRTRAPLNLARYLADFHVGAADAVLRQVVQRSPAPEASLAGVQLGE